MRAGCLSDLYYRSSKERRRSQSLYSPKCLEYVFSEVRLYGDGLGSKDSYARPEV